VSGATARNKKSEDGFDEKDFRGGDKSLHYKSNRRRRPGDALNSSNFIGAKTSLGGWCELPEGKKWEEQKKRLGKIT